MTPEVQKNIDELKRLTDALKAKLERREDLARLEVLRAENMRLRSELHERDCDEADLARDRDGNIPDGWVPTRKGRSWRNAIDAAAARAKVDRF